MRRRTFVRPEAQEDIREAARWYEDRESDLGLRFLREPSKGEKRCRHKSVIFSCPYSQFWG